MKINRSVYAMEIADAEAIHGPGTGPEKKQRVVKAFQEFDPKQYVMIRRDEAESLAVQS